VFGITHKMKKIGYVSTREMTRIIRNEFTYQTSNNESKNLESMNHQTCVFENS
jgi:hypothetical protein